MGITEYRKELERKGYKTKRIKRADYVEYFAYKNGKYYYFAISGLLNEKAFFEINLKHKKKEYTDPILKAFGFVNDNVQKKQ